MGGALKNVKRHLSSAARIGALLCCGALAAAMPSASNTAYAAAKREPPYSDRTLVIDAGHGGADGGAVSAGGARESEINLDIALRLYMLAGFLGERAVLTRSSEDIAYSDEAVTVREKKRDDMKQRLAIIHSTENAVLVSIHQNKFDTPGPSGAQVIYAPDDESGALGETVQNALTEYLWRGNRQGAVRDNGAIYLLNNAACPAILIECGFLSNPAEEALLLTGRYRARVAAAIAGALRR